MGSVVRGDLQCLAVAMLPFTVACCFVANTLSHRAQPAAGSGAGRKRVDVHASDKGAAGGKIEGRESAAAVVMSLFKNRVWVTAALGYSAWSFTVGAFAVWSPTYLYSVLGVPLEVADVQFGAITLGNGLVGTAVGGVLLDVLVRRLGTDVASASLIMVCGLTAAAVPCLLAAFLLQPTWAFYVGLVIGEFFLFSITSPVNGVFLWCVPPQQRSMSIAVMNIVIHLLGDVFSPAIAGALWSATNDARFTMACVSAWLGWAVLMWGLSATFSLRLNSAPA